jgi:hypothetical protein
MTDIPSNENETESPWGDPSNASANTPPKKRSKKQAIIAAAAAVVLCGGVFAGVQVFSHRTSSADGAGGPAGRFGAMGGFGDGTRGTLQGVSGSTLTVTNARDSSTSTVTTSEDTVFLETVTGSASDLKVGDNITVSGSTGSDGMVTATRVTDSGSIVMTAGLGGFGGQSGQMNGAAPQSSQSPPDFQDGEMPQLPNGANGNGQQPTGMGNGAGPGGGVGGVIASISADTVTVTDASGGTSTVKLTSSTTVSVLHTISLGDLATGDTVTVQESTDNGTTTATRVIVGVTGTQDAPPAV